MKKIAAALDLSEMNDVVANQVGQLATHLGAEVWLIHVAEQLALRLPDPHHGRTEAGPLAGRVCGPQPRLE